MKPCVSATGRNWTVWSKQEFAYWCNLTYEAHLECSSRRTYSSATKAYLTFCSVHQRPINPTIDNLADFVIYMSQTRVNPSSVKTYLSGICHDLLPYYPNIRENHLHPLVTAALQGSRKLCAMPTIRKRVLLPTELVDLCYWYRFSDVYNDLLFLCITLIGFHALLRLGEMVVPDDRHLRDPRKVTQRHTVRVNHDSVSFLLPGHKADRFFSGNEVLVRSTDTLDDPTSVFRRYLQSCDQRFRCYMELWLTSTGDAPTRTWYLSQLHRHFDHDVSGYLLRSGGATALAQ
jgi:hypothetical protein